LWQINPAADRRRVNRMPAMITSFAVSSTVILFLAARKLVAVVADQSSCWQKTGEPHACHDHLVCRIKQHDFVF
jgi:hypothetical protein